MAIKRGGGGLREVQWEACSTRSRAAAGSATAVRRAGGGLRRPVGDDTVVGWRGRLGLGPAQSALLIVIAQLIAAWLIELFGLFGMEKTSFEWRKLIGMAVAIAGIILFKWEK